MITAVGVGVLAFGGVLGGLFMWQKEFPKTWEGFVAWIKSGKPIDPKSYDDPDDAA